MIITLDCNDVLTWNLSQTLLLTSRFIWKDNTKRLNHWFQMNDLKQWNIFIDITPYLNDELTSNYWFLHTFRFIRKEKPLFMHHWLQLNELKQWKPWMVITPDCNDVLTWNLSQILLLRCRFIWRDKTPRINHWFQLNELKQLTNRHNSLFPWCTDLKPKSNITFNIKMHMKG